VAGRGAIVRREGALMPEQAQCVGIALRQRRARDDGHGAFRPSRRFSDLGTDQQTAEKPKRSRAKKKEAVA